MTNYREILRLHSLGLNKTEIAASCQCARNTVAATLQRAANCGLQWPLPEEMSDKQLSERLFPSGTSKPVYKMPDYAYVHKELQRSGVTLNLLWLEYCEACRNAGNPDRVLYFFSTSKITFPGAGVSMVAASENNRKEILKTMGIQTIGYDKMNQVRTLNFLKDAANTRLHMKKLADSLREKFDIVLTTLERNFAGTPFAKWHKPMGGYFVALDTMPGCAKETIRLAADAGVKLTEAGATYPYHNDPNDSNIRIAPSFPPCSELREAMYLLCICIKLVAVRKLLTK